MHRITLPHVFTVDDATTVISDASDVAQEESQPTLDSVALNLDHSYASSVVEEQGTHAYQPVSVLQKD